MASLSLAQFTQSTPTAGVNSVLLSYKVPHNSYIYINNSEHMRLRIPAYQSFSYTAAQSADNVTVDVSATPAIVPNIYNAPAFQLSALGYWVATAPTAVTKIVYPTAISGSSITFAVNDTTSTAASLNVYYSLAVGSYQWVISYPNATGQADAVIKTEAIEDVNSRSQSAVDSQLFFPINIILPEDFYLSLYVNAPVAANMTLGQTTTVPNLLANISLPIESGTMSALLKQNPNIVKDVKKYLADVS